MNDDILNRFIEKLVTQNIDEDIFRETSYEKSTIN